MTTHISMKQLPDSERPYEKFLHAGPQSLSDAELLAVIIKSGTPSLTSIEVATRILAQGQGNLLNLHELSLQELQKIPGIGRVKAIQLKAVAELSRRIAVTDRGYYLQMKDPASIADYYMEQLRHQKTEVLMAAFFDSKCHFLGDMKISIGSVSSAYVSPREIFRQALLRDAVQFVLLHNHPSGDPSASEDDRRITQRIHKIGELMQLSLVDHIIIGDNQYYSFMEHHLL